MIYEKDIFEMKQRENLIKESLELKMIIGSILKNNKSIILGF